MISTSEVKLRNEKPIPDEKKITEIIEISSDSSSQSDIDLQK